MKLKLERWNGNALSLAYAQHSRASRITLRIATLGVSLHINPHYNDRISPVLEKAAWICVGGALASLNGAIREILS